MELTEKYLYSVLTHFLGASTDQWGKGEAKSVLDLLQEINEGDCYLRIGSDGLCRVTEIVKMQINSRCIANQRLMEVGEYLADGRFQERGREPSGQIKLSETAEQCLWRGMPEEPFF